MRTFIQTADTTICIEWSDGTLSQAVRNLYRPWQIEYAENSLAIHIEGREGGYTLIQNGAETFCDTPPQVILELEFMVTQRLQQAFDNYLRIHACTIEYKGNAAVIVGNHGNGKTTLACAAITHGMKALADDMTVIGKDIRTVVGFPRPFKITSDTRAMHPSIVPADCPTAATDDDTLLFFHEPDGKYYAPWSTIRHILFMTRRDGPTHILPLGEIMAIRRLLPQGFNFYLKQESLLDELHQLFAASPPRELLFSNHIDAVNQLREMLR